MNIPSMSSAPEIELSVVTTARNEEGNVAEFLQRCQTAFDALEVTGEIIFFDDASSDRTYAIARNFAADHPGLAMTVIRNPAQKGIVNAIVNGSSIARGKYMCFLPSDLESLPDDDIPILYRAVDDATDVVAGWRQGRADNKVQASAVYNYLNGKLFGISFNDGNWIKLVRREKLDNLVLLSDWHSILLGLLAGRGCRIKEVPTQWHARKFGKSKFGVRRFAHAIAAAISGKAYLAFGERPLLLFLTISTLFLLASLLAALIALFLPGPNVVLLLMSFTSVILASISASAGLSVEALRWGRFHAQIRIRETSPVTTGLGGRPYSAQ